LLIVLHCITVVYTIEFQKRGLPHSHMIIWLHKNSKKQTPEDIDEVISAEIPNPSIDLIGYQAVTEFMMHGPCGVGYENSPCMVQG
jgi:hypothetical protein